MATQTDKQTIHAAQTQLQDRHVRCAVLKDQRWRGARRHDAQKRLRDGGNLSHTSLNLRTFMAAFAEGIILGQALGLSQTVLIDALLATPAAAPFLASKRTKIIKGDYEAEFPLRWQQRISISHLRAAMNLASRCQ